MAHSAGIGISWFGLILIVFVVFLIVKAVANPRSRPFVVGLLLMFGVAAFVLVGFRSVRQEARMTEWDQATRAETDHEAVIVQSSPPLPPGYSSMHSPRNGKISAASAKLAKANKSDTSNKSEKSAKPSTPPKDESEDAAPQPPEPPAWVKAEPKSKGDVYLMTRQTDPYTTSLECEREVPKALQSAVSEYAQLLLGGDQARYVHLPESDLRRLERDRWIETREIDVGGETKDMLTLHLLIGFDPAMKDHIRTMAENAVVTQRLQGAGVVLGGVLGLLALVWGGLSLTGSRQCANPIQEAAAPAAVKSYKFSVLLAAGVIAAIVLFAALLSKS